MPDLHEDSLRILAGMVSNSDIANDSDADDITKAHQMVSLAIRLAMAHAQAVSAEVAAAESE